MLTSLRQNIDEYVKGKNWYFYLPMWLFGLYLYIKLFSFELGATAPSFFIAIAQSLNFFLHEVSHLVTAFLPSLITASAGSASELLLTSGLIIGAFATRGYFASLFCFLWFMLATQATADYIADAKAMNLPLVSFGGGDPIHDWNFILTKLGLLEQYALIAGIVRWTGYVAATFGLLFSLWLMFRFYKSARDERHKKHMDEIMSQTASLDPASRPDQKFIGGDLYPDAKRGNLVDRDTDSNIKK